MKKLTRFGAMILAGALVIPGGLGLTAPVQAQQGSKPLTDEQYQKMQQKRQEQWQTLEDIQKRQENTGQRLQDAQKRRQDALKRQKAAEKALQEMEK